MNLADESCVPSRADSAALDDNACVDLLNLLEDWRIASRDDVDRLVRRFQFGNFADALAFSNAVGAIAEAEDHHPTLLTEWGRVEVTLWTHVIGGLHRNDFIMAAKCDRAYAETLAADR